MTALVWMLTWLPQVLSVMSELPKPEKLKITSKDFIHILTWEPGQGTPTGVCYNVTINRDRESSWKHVTGCEGVQHPLVCNLTNAFSDPRQNYNTRVTAILGQRTSFPTYLHEFKPTRDTELDTPLLTVTPNGKNLCVDLQPPIERLKEIYDIFNYKLKIQSHGEDIAQGVDVRDIKSLKRHTVEDLAPGRQYCFSVCFSDKLESRESNYSQPICAFTTDIFIPDPWISAGLCVSVMFLVVVTVFLFYTGFICLKRRRLPSVLTSVRHMEEALANALSSTSLPSLVNVKPALPSLGEKRHKESSSDESDGESETERTGGVYKLQGGTNLTSSSSLSSSTLLAPLSPEPEPQPLLSSNQTSDSAETHSSAGPNHILSADTDSRSIGTTEQEEQEEMVVGEGSSQDVNLLTLTFGRQEEEEEGEQKSHLDVAEADTEAPSPSEECSILSVQPSQSEETSKIAIETVSSSADEDEEEEEHSGYMGRPRTDVLRTLL